MAKEVVLMRVRRTSPHDWCEEAVYLLNICMSASQEMCGQHYASVALLVPPEKNRYPSYRRVVLCQGLSGQHGKSQTQQGSTHGPC